MITCRDFVDELGNLVGGHLEELPGQLEQHAEGCPSCRAYLDSYRMTIRVCRQLPRPPLPEGLTRRLKEILAGGGTIPGG